MEMAPEHVNWERQQASTGSYRELCHLRSAHVKTDFRVGKANQFSGRPDAV